MVISRKYEVLGQLGQGGMGVVYKVRHAALENTLALKVLARELSENPEMLARFYREARVMARLSHPNVVQVLDIDRDDSLNFHYFVMEYIPGKTLLQLVQEKGPLPLGDVLEISRQVAVALTYAHNHTPPVIHRDIKPANIMIEDRSARVVVMDFGIAKELDEHEATKSGVVVGTLKYCSPEQMRHEPLTGAADIYSLGMAMYEAYSGTPFFAGLDEAMVIGKVLYELRENEPHFSRSAPPAFAALVTKAIAKSRERRYQRVEDFLHDLEACQATLAEGKTITLLEEWRKGVSPAAPAQEVMPQPVREDLPTVVEMPKGTAQAETADLSGWAQGPVTSPADAAGTQPNRGPVTQEPDPLVPVGPDEDQWEIGEGAAAQAAPPSRPPLAVRPSRMKPALIGVGAVGMLAVLVWVGGMFLRRPAPLPLTLVRAEPQTEAVKVTEGEELAFAAEAAGTVPLRYEWTVQEQRVSQEPAWSYRPAAGESAPEPKRVRLLVTDQHGQRVEKRWQVTVSRAAVTAAPEKQVAVLASPPALPVPSPVPVPPSVPVAPPVPEKPPPPKNAPPRIALRLPEERILTVKEGESLNLSALAVDPEGDEVAYTWSVDGKKAAQGERFSFTATATRKGGRRIDLEVTDRGGLKDSARWEVKVEALPAAPRLVMFTPYQTRFALYPHLSRFFGVEVEVPGTIEPALRYEWKVDGQPAAGKELFEFKNQPTGTHEVEVTTTAPSGVSLTQRWTVEVREEQASSERAPIWSPYLEVFDLENTVTADKKQVLVTGKIRNIDERSADNVVVWITARDEKGEPVARRLALPNPQPLAPGQVAAFRVPLANHDAATDFRVEVVSK